MPGRGNNDNRNNGQRGGGRGNQPRGGNRGGYQPRRPQRRGFLGFFGS